MKVICIDDEHLSLDYLEIQLRKIAEVGTIKKYLDPEDALQVILQESVDIVMLDIHMPEINGMELAETILEAKPDLHIVFITAYSQYAVDAFKLNAIDYLVKPITLDRLQVTINRIYKQTHLYKAANGKAKTLWIQTTGQLLFQAETEEGQVIPWRTSKTQELFIYLLQNRGRVVDKSAILDLLWKDVKIERSYALLYTTIYNVRKALRPFQHHFKLHNMGNGYFLELKRVELDIVVWEDRLRRLGAVNVVTIDNFINLMKLFPEPYLEQLDYVWLESERERLEGLWKSTAKSIADYYEQAGDCDVALFWRKRICERHSEDEVACLSILKLYKRMGKLSLVHQEYAKMEQMLKETLDIEPSRSIQEWYAKVKSE